MGGAVLGALVVAVAVACACGALAPAADASLSVPPPAFAGTHTARNVGTGRDCQLRGGGRRRRQRHERRRAGRRISSRSRGTGSRSTAAIPARPRSRPGTWSPLARSRLQPWGLELGPEVAVANDGFASVNSHAGFTPFSPPNVWAPFNSNTAELQIVAPAAQTSTPAPALTRGLGVVFLNVKTAGTTIQYYSGNSLLSPGARRRSATSFAGLLFRDPVVTRVVVTLGTATMFNLDGSPGRAGPDYARRGRRHRAGRARRRAAERGRDRRRAGIARARQLHRNRFRRHGIRLHRDDRLGRRRLGAAARSCPRPGAASSSPAAMPTRRPGATARR